MIVFLTLIYVALLGVLVWMGKLPNSAKTWFTVPIWMVLLLIFLFFRWLTAHLRRSGWSDL